MPPSIYLAAPQKLEIQQDNNKQEMKKKIEDTFSPLSVFFPRRRHMIDAQKSLVVESYIFNLDKMLTELSSEI